MVVGVLNAIWGLHLVVGYEESDMAIFSKTAKSSGLWCRGLMGTGF